MTQIDERELVIAAGALPALVLERLSARFEIIALAKSSPELIPANLASRVRAIAVMGGCSAAFMEALPNLKLISSFGVGYDAVDVQRALSLGVTVAHTPDVLNDEVADTAVGLLISTIRELPQADLFLRQGHWAKGERYPLTRGTLGGRKVGIFGLGRIGQAIARRLEPFNVGISYHNRRPVPGVKWEWQPTLLALAEGVDTLICAVPGGAGTVHAVNAKILSALGSEGVLINIGRGSTVDESALAHALKQGVILAAGLDVFEREPHVPEELIALPNAVLLPHIGTASIPTRNRMGDLVVRNVVAWFEQGVAITPVPECVAYQNARG